MDRGFRSLRDCVFHNPLGLSCLPSKTRQLANWYLPRDTGIEFEITFPEGPHNVQRMILDMKLMDCNWGTTEQTFRIRAGEAGMIELYKITQLLKKYYQLNPGSGIHYHTDCPIINYDNQEDVRAALRVRASEPWLKELDSWGYKGKYNSREIALASKGHWINMRPDFHTVEYRIGEMTFDYTLLMKRIVHCHSLTRKIERVIKTGLTPNGVRVGKLKQSVRVLDSDGSMSSIFDD